MFSSRSTTEFQIYTRLEAGAPADGLREYTIQDQAKKPGLKSGSSPARNQKTIALENELHECTGAYSMGTGK
jgi:hypothetical protein